MRRAKHLRAIFAVLGAVMALALLADGVEAQRRRGRPRPRPRPAATDTAGTGETGTDATGTDATGTPPTNGAMANPPPNITGTTMPPPPPPGTGTGPGQNVNGATTQPATGAGAQVGGEGTPVANEEPTGPDLAPLRAEYTSVMDELVRVRSRVATLGRALFRTRVRILVQNRADDQSLARIALELDGAPIYRADGSQFQGEDGRQVFEGFAAPGPHNVTIEVEQRARENDQYRYTMRNQFRFEVIREKLTEIIVILDDDSDIADDFPDDGEGEYDVRTRVRVATRDIDAR